MIELNKIYNMDCLEGMDKMIEQGIKVDAIITDIPYGTTQNKWDTIIPFEEMWGRLKLLRKDTTPIILFGNEPFSSKLRNSNSKEYKYDWIWIKEKGKGHLNAKKQPLRAYENICVFYKKQCIYNPQMREGEPYKRENCSKDKLNKGNYGGVNESHTTISTGERYPLNTIYFQSLQRTIHPTQKPVELIEYLIKTYTNENDTVLDFTIGSGTTAIACINTNRNYIGFELDSTYFDLAENRIKEHTPNKI